MFEKFKEFQAASQHALAGVPTELAKHCNMVQRERRTTSPYLSPDGSLAGLSGTSPELLYIKFTWSERTLCFARLLCASV